MEAILFFVTIVFALFFNFVNGMNDAANSIATVIGTRTISPLHAVLLAGSMNFIGPFIFGTAIAETIGVGILEGSVLNCYVLFSAAFTAVLWVLLSTRYGIPISSSHALIGGMMGAAVAYAGLGSVLWPSPATIVSLAIYMAAGGICGAVILLIFAKIKKKEPGIMPLVFFAAGACLVVPVLMVTGTLPISGILAVLIFIVVSPAIGFITAYTLIVVMALILNRKVNRGRINSAMKPLHVLSAAALAISHGANDAQNAMGIITSVLLAAGVLSTFEVPRWVIISSCLAIAMGTMIGGCNVIDKMANKITHISQYQGFAASTGGAMILSLMTAFGVPVSTTHAISGSIMGAGATRGRAAVNWSASREIVTAWFVTIPASMALSYVVMLLIMAVFG